jgi:hypothetical protein
MDEEKRLIICRWLTQAFEAGQLCPQHSDQRSEYWSPTFEYDWAPKILAELEAAQES